MDKRIIILMSVLIAAVMFAPTVNAALTQVNNQTRQTTPAVAAHINLATMVEQITSSNYTTMVVHPPTIVIQSFGKILSSPGHYAFSQGNMLSSRNAFIISTTNYTIVGTALPNQNETIYAQFGNTTIAFVLGAPDGTQYSMAMPGGGTMSIIPKADNITDSVTIVTMFAMYTPVSVKKAHIGDAPAPCEDCGGGGSYTWTNQMSASSGDYVLYVDAGIYDEGDTVMSYTVYAAIDYTSSSILDGSILVSATYLATLPAGPDGPTYFDSGIIQVSGPSSFYYGMTLSGSGSDYGTTLYTYQSTTMYASVAASWSNPDATVVCSNWLPTSMSVPQLT